MLKKTPGNLEEDSGECWRRFRGKFEKIPENVLEDSGKCWKRFREILKKIPGNVRRDFGGCSRRFRGMLKKNSGNINLDLFCKILLIFYQTRYWLLHITNLQHLNTVFLPPFSFSISFSCRENGVITVRKCRGIKKL